MKREIIERQLTDWFGSMLQKYAWLSIKYEYSNVERCFLVSFSPSILTKVSEDFSEDALKFENKMNIEHDIDAPLFCDDEELFKLSSDATLLSNPNISTFTSELSSNSAQFDLVEMTGNQLTEQDVDTGEFCYTNNEFNIAA